MAYKLSWDAAALDAVKHFRNHQPELAIAFERVLDRLRLDGSVSGSSYYGDSISAHVVSVFVHGYAEQTVIWIRQPDDRPRIVYVGALDE